MKTVPGPSRVLLAIWYDYELEVLSCKTEKEAMARISEEIEVISETGPLLFTEDEAWEYINDHGIPLNFKMRKEYD